MSKRPTVLRYDVLSQQTEFDFQSNSYVSFAIVPTPTYYLQSISLFADSQSFFVDTFKKLQSKNDSAYPQKLIFCPTAEEISTYSNDNNTYMRARGSDSMASLTSMTCDDDLRGACSKGWEPPFIGDKEEMERLSKLRKTASLPYIHQRNPSFSYKSKGIGLMVDHISIWEI